MGAEFGWIGLMALVVALPAVVHHYLQRLPYAPACPECRMVTRQREPSGWALYLLSILPITVRGECTRCGWKGRMRLRWATRSVHGRR